MDSWIPWMDVGGDGGNSGMGAWALGVFRKYYLLLK